MIVELASVEDAEASYHSPAWQAARPLREGAAGGMELIVLEGLA